MGLYPTEIKTKQIGSKHILRFFFYLLVAEWMWVVLSGCSPKKTIVERETVYKESYRDTTIYLPGEIVQQGLSDSFLNMLKTGFKSGLKDTVKIISRQGNAELKVWMDEFGNMQASCEAKDRQIDLLLKTIEKYSSENKETVKEVKVKVIPRWIYLLTGISVLGSLFMLVKYGIKVIRF